jgi:hypothetical protein
VAVRAHEERLTRQLDAQTRDKVIEAMKLILKIGELRTHETYN